MKLRSYLILLVVTALVPVLIFAGALLAVYHFHQRQAVENALAANAHGVSLDIDRELTASIRALQGLATSEYLDSGDLKRFHVQVRRAIEAHEGWQAIVLMDTEEQHLINTRLPYGAPLPRGGIPEAVALILKTGRPAVSNLFFGPTAKRPLLAVAVPVVRDGRIKYILGVSTSPEYLTDILAQQQLPTTWTTTVIDRNKKIVARSQDLDRLLGGPGNPMLAQRSREATGGFFFGVTRTGMPVATGFHRSRLTDWTVGVSIPQEELTQPTKRSLSALAGGGLLFLFVGSGSAYLLSIRMTRGIAALAAAAESIGGGEAPRFEHSPIVEVAGAARAVKEAWSRHKQAEFALERIRRQNEVILNSVGEGIHGVDLQGRIVFENPASAALLGWETNDLIGKQAHQTMHHTRPDGSPYPVEECSIYAAFTRGDARYVTDEVFWRKEGASFPVEYMATPMRDENGAIIGAVVVFRDISDRKRADAEIRRSLEAIRALHEIDLAISSTLDLKDVLRILLEKIKAFSPMTAVATIRLLNKRTGELELLACRGIEEEEWKRFGRGAIGGRTRRVVDSKAPLVVSDIADGPPGAVGEILVRHGLVSYAGIPLTLKNEAIGVLGIYTDRPHKFTDDEIELLNNLASQAAIAINNASAYEELAHANKIKNEFLSVMSHELRTPLSGIMGYVGLVQDGMLGEINDEQKQALKKVLARANDQLQMINTIMQTTQLEARAIQAQLEAVNVTALLDGLKSDYSIYRTKPDVSLAWDYPREPQLVVSDAAKLKQILENLINNALKFTDAGMVTITARLETAAIRGAAATAAAESAAKRRLRLSVSDTGLGIEREKLALIFEKFYQVDSSETRLYGGAGLGLYIVKQYTELLGGDIAVESVPGKGSTFTVTIPLQA